MNKTSHRLKDEKYSFREAMKTKFPLVWKQSLDFVLHSFNNFILQEIDKEIHAEVPDKYKIEKIQLWIERVQNQPDGYLPFDFVSSFYQEAKMLVPDELRLMTTSIPNLALEYILQTHDFSSDQLKDLVESALIPQ